MLIRGDRRDATGNSFATTTVTVEPIGCARAAPIPAASPPTDPVTKARSARGESPDDGSGQPVHCDVAAYADHLAADPVKAAARAGVRGFALDEIRGYRTGLTPALVHDTPFTKRGFTGDPTRPRPTRLDSVNLLGTRWAGDDPTRVSIIWSGAKQVGFVLVDVPTGERPGQRCRVRLRRLGHVARSLAFPSSRIPC